MLGQLPTHGATLLAQMVLISSFLSVLPSFLKDLFIFTCTGALLACMPI